jgi:DNA-binding transcriptional regulator YiaG
MLAKYKAKDTQLSLFSETLPKKPYCTDNHGHGLVIRNIAHAIKKRYIQPNNPNSRLWLVYDIDRPTSPEEITDDLNLPAPNFFVQNPDNQHAHAFYGLDVPVHFNNDSSKKAIRFAASVDVLLTAQIKGDASYSGLMAKNPLHEHWRTWECNTERYELNDLAEYLDINKYKDLRKSLPSIGLGRNCNLFENLRQWSYRAIRQGWPNYDQWLHACLDRANGYNINAESALDMREVTQVAKSVAKYTHRNFSAQGFSEWQAVQGAKGGKAKGKAYSDKRSQALKMLSDGVKQKSIAERLNVSDRTIRNWKSGK